jgi:hypothetical protein
MIGKVLLPWMSLDFICGQATKKFEFKRVSNRNSVNSVGIHNRHINGGFRQLG